MPISLDILPNIISEVRSTLFSVKNQDLLKLIYYDSERPYEQNNLTPIQLINMVSPNNTSTEHPNERRIFYNSFNGKIESEATTQIHMYIDSASPKNRALANIFIRFHIITHLNISAIYGKNSTASFPTQNRHEAILSEMLRLLNEQDVGGIGRLLFVPEVPYRHQVWVLGENWIGGDFAMQIGST